MKNAMLNLISSKLALVSFVLAGMFLLAPDSLQAQAQKVKGAEYVSESEAISRLEIETAALKQLIESLTPGSFAFKSANWKYELYDAVLNQLYEGKTVPVAVEHGIAMYYTDRFAEMPASLKKANINELKLILHP